MNPGPFYINIVAIILALWTIPWKLYAVWLAVKNNQRRWFIALVILNTLAILEIYYIFFVAKRKWVDVKQDFRTALASVK